MDDISDVAYIFEVDNAENVLIKLMQNDTCWKHVYQLIVFVMQNDNGSDSLHFI